MSPAAQRRLLTLAGLGAARSLLESSDAVLRDDVTVAAEIAALREEGARIARAERGGVPEALALRCGIRRQIATPVVVAVTPLVTGSAVSAVLSGPTGTGKSHAAARALSALGGRWVPAVTLNDFRAPAWADLDCAGLLVVDEVDATVIGERVAQIVCNRHDHGKRTIITCNDVPGWWGKVDPAGRLRSRCESSGVLWPDPGMRTETRPERETVRDRRPPDDVVAEHAGLALAAHWLWSDTGRHMPAHGRSALVLLRAMQIEESEFLAELGEVEARQSAGAELIEAAVRRGLGERSEQSEEDHETR